MITLKHQLNAARLFLATKYRYLIAEMKKLQRFRFRQVISKKTMPVIAFMLASMMLLVPLTALATNNDSSSAEKTYGGEDDGNGEPPPPETYVLTMGEDPSAGGGATDQTNDGPYEEGSRVDILADAEESWEFVGWTADAGSFAEKDALDTTFTMPAKDVTVTANFEEIEETVTANIEETEEEYTLTVSSTNGGEVTVPGEGGDFTYEEGEEVTVTATAEDGYEFVSWTDEDGGEKSTEDSYTFDMPNSDLSLVAAFEEVEVEVFEAAQNGDGDPDPGPSTTTQYVQPVFLQGNDPPPDQGCTAYKLDHNTAGTYKVGEGEFERDQYDQNAPLLPDDAYVTITIPTEQPPEPDEIEGQSFDWESSHSFGQVFVKGGNYGNMYDYTPAKKNDTYLHTPQGAGGGTKYYDISHITFYYCGEPTIDPEPDLTITKEADTAVSKVGDPINYTVVVTNTGDVDLEVVVDDSLEGELYNDVLVAEASETFEYTYNVQEDDSDPLVNTVTATGDHESLDYTIEEEASASVDLVEPAVELTKAVTPLTTQVGDTVTYTITVENTGDWGLENIIVTDDLLDGDITEDFGFDEPLEPDDWEEATFDYIINEADVSEGEVVNTANVSSNPVGLTNDIVDDDSAEVTVSDLLPGSLEIVKKWDDLPDYFDLANLPESIEVTISGDQ
ncbi:MAG: InlB B-repeat-containing protein, partial [Bacillota bacterium]